MSLLGNWRDKKKTCTSYLLCFPPSKLFSISVSSNGSSSHHQYCGRGPPRAKKKKHATLIPHLFCNHPFFVPIPALLASLIQFKVPIQNVNHLIWVIKKSKLYKTHFEILTALCLLGKFPETMLAHNKLQPEKEPHFSYSESLQQQQ